VEDADPVADDTARRTDFHLAREVSDDPDVVVAEHQFDLPSLFEEPCEEIENDRSQGRRRPDDRVLGVPRDEDAIGPACPEDARKLLGKRRGRCLGRPRRPGGRAAESEVHIRDDEGPRAGAVLRLDQERRCVRHGSQGRLRFPRHSISDLRRRCRSCPRDGPDSPLRRCASVRGDISQGSASASVPRRSLRADPAPTEETTRDVEAIVKAVMKEHARGLSIQRKWGMPRYAGRDVVCVIGRFTRHVGVGFWRGSNLPDPYHILEGTGKKLRHVVIRSHEEARAPAFAQLVRGAVELDREEERRPR
jgi:hypothetical protein